MNFYWEWRQFQFMEDKTARLIAIAASTRGIVTIRQLYDLGYREHEIRAQVRRGNWRRVHRGIFRVMEAADQTEHRRGEIRAVLQELGESAVAVLTTAGRLLGLAGLPLFDGIIHISVSPISARAHRANFRIHQLRLLEGDVIVKDGIAMTHPVRTVADLSRLLSKRDAVAVIDSALHKGLISTQDLPELYKRIRRRRNAKSARMRLIMTDGRAESPLESWIRVILAEAGLAPPELQYPIYANDQLLGIADMAWPNQKVIIEADGEQFHALPSALLHDRRRQNELVNNEWHILRFSAADCRYPAYILEKTRYALNRRSG